MVDANGVTAIVPVEETGPIPLSMVIEVALDTFQLRTDELPDNIVPGFE
jgi:hypothetical protein